MAILWAAVALATVCNGIWFAASASENRRLTWRPVFLAVVCSETKLSFLSRPTSGKPAA